jgi:hypothetical protein
LNLPRSDLVEAFHNFVASGDGVVLGAPGVGKTHLLRAFAIETIDAKESVCFFLPVDRASFASDADLRSEFGITGDIVSYFARETRTKRGYFVVDALDAARSDRARAFVLGLVRRVLGRLSDSWTVVLSIRTYDALRSIELEELFPAPEVTAPPAPYQLGGVVCRHFFLPPLSDADIQAAQSQLSWLASIWATAHEELRDLLRVPFNLWLLERLFAGGADASDISPVYSEVQLLDLFWRQRVCSGRYEPDRRLLTSRAAQAMVRQRTLRARTEDVYEAGANEAWLNLYSGEVLRDADDEGHRVSFAHNVLFDYAASVELLDENAHMLATFLEEEPDRALFLRPTLNYFFARLWFKNRDTFWEIFWGLAANEKPHVRLVAQVLPPGVVAQEARHPEDIAPLLERLREGESDAAQAVLRVLQGIRTHGVDRDRLWSEFAASTAEHPSPVFAWDMARFLAELLDRDGAAPHPDTDTREYISQAARLLLRWALTSRDPGLEHLAAVWLLGVVARTYDVDPADNSDLLGSLVARVEDPTISIDLIYRLAHAAEDLWDNDPDLVASLYAAVFSHVETSQESTHMGGIVVALRSNRRQDFEMAQYVLVENAPKFLRQQPKHAIPAIVTATIEAVRVGELLPYADRESLPEEQEFNFHGRRVRYLADGSHFWDASGTVRGDQHKLLDALFSFLADLPHPEINVEEAIDLIADHTSFAFIWRNLLAHGAREPERYGHGLQELLLAEPILVHPETAPEAAAFLRAVEPSLSDEFVGMIEATIVRLVELGDERSRHWCMRLVAQLPQARLETGVARALRAEALEDANARSNRPLVSFSTFSEAFDEESWLREEGIEPDEPANRRILAATDGLQEFASKFINEETLPPEDVDAAVAAIDTAMEALRDATELPATLLDKAWARISDAAALAALATELSERDLGILREALLACVVEEAPRPVADPDGSFTSPAWSPAARNGAAQGIPRLLLRRCDDALLAALRALATDIVPSVRFLVARELPRLIPSQEEPFWQVAELYAEREENRLVQQALCGALAAVASSDREQRVTKLLDRLLARIPLAEMARSFLYEDQIGGLIVGLAVARENEWAIEKLRGALDDSPPAYLSTLVLHLLHFIDFQWTADAARRPIVERALVWLPPILARVATSLRTEIEKSQGAAEVNQEAIRELFEVIDHIVSRFYFQSGVYKSEKRPAATREEICAFFKLIQPHLRQIGELTGGSDGLGMPAHTAHHLIELLRGSLSCNPPEVLRLTRLAIDGARGAGYAFDPMAAREVTALVETTLADHREAARSGEALGDLMRVLDAFVEAGWPEAQRLVWRLEDLFR